MKHIPEETLDLARKMRAEGSTWNAIGRAVGMSGDTIRYRLDEEHAQKVREARQGPRSTVYVTSDGISKKELLRLLNSVPKDTRSRNARLFGDPLPGRSALDRKTAGIAP